jgi:hypothetical protein
MTGNEGAVSVTVTVDGIGPVADWRADHPRLWREPAEPVPRDLE